MVLANAPPDYSAEAESDLLQSGRAALPIVFATPKLTIFEVPRPRRIVTGPGMARIVAMREDSLVVRVGAPGTYRIAVRYSAHWHASAGCVASGKDGMIRLRAPQSGSVKMTIQVSPGQVLDEIAGAQPKACT